MSGLYSYGKSEPTSDREDRTDWMVTPEGPTTWGNGGQQRRRLRRDEQGLFTLESAPNRATRETFTGEEPSE